MSHLQALYNEISSNLRITSYIRAKVGHQINEGEPFTMVVEAMNTAPNNKHWRILEERLGSYSYDGPQLVFTNMLWSIEETYYADLISPVGSFGSTRFRGITNLHAGDSRLEPGEEQVLTLQFVARHSFSDWWTDAFNTEQVAKVALTYDVAWDELMRHTMRKTLSTEIDPS